jgi:uncharacterized caspase-like protein
MVSGALAERRVALVVGNSSYAHAVKLPNPQNDAEAIAQLLTASGFDVVLGTNLTREGLLERIGQFADAARVAETALFFYAGHAIQLDGKNYLIPVDADLKNELQAKSRTIDMDTVLQDAMGEAKRKVVLLDACRDNPFTKQIQASLPKTRSSALQTGLAEMRPSEGTLIAFATGPGQVALDGEGAHSPFTRALLAHLPKPGVEIRHALTNVRAQVQEETRKQQLPWENTNMVGFFYLVPGAAVNPQTSDRPTTAAVTAAVTSAFDPRMLELEFWNSVKASAQPADYQAYLEKYPNGTFSQLAKSRLAGLASPGATPTLGLAPGAAAAPPAVAGGDIRAAEANQATEDAIGLDRSKWRDIQKRLTGLGFSTRGVDGGVGQNTRKAVALWQSARSYPQSGYLNRLQHQALLAEPVSIAADKDEDDEPAQPTTRSARPSSTASSNRGQSSQNSSGGSSGTYGPGAREAGEFVGGVLRGVSRGRLPF